MPNFCTDSFWDDLQELTILPSVAYLLLETLNNNLGYAPSFHAYSTLDKLMTTYCPEREGLMGLEVYHIPSEWGTWSGRVQLSTTHLPFQGIFWSCPGVLLLHWCHLAGFSSSISALTFVCIKQALLFSCFPRSTVLFAEQLPPLSASSQSSPHLWIWPLLTSYNALSVWLLSL